jgi:hypothetical protein
MVMELVFRCIGATVLVRIPPNCLVIQYVEVFPTIFVLAV